MSKELVAWTKDIAKSQDLDFQEVLAAVEEALAVSVRRQHEGERIFRVELDPKTGEQRIYRQWKIVEDVMLPTKEISLEAALLDDPNAQVGQYVEDLEEGEEIKHDRIGFTTFRQIMTTKIRELKRKAALESYTPFLGKIVTGTVRKASPNKVVVNLPSLNEDYQAKQHLEETNDDSSSVEAIIRRKDMIPGERYRTNTPVRALLLAIENEPNNRPVAILTRTAPEFVNLLLRRQVPEIEQGKIEVVNIVREPGVRCKVAVKSNDPNLDVIGAVVGVKTTRIQSIVQELSGERVDIIEYSDDLPTYIHNALCQPEIEKIVIDEANNTVEIAVNKDNLSLTIGKAGINVKLASRLINWRIKVLDTEQFEQQKVENEQSMIQAFVDGLGVDEESAHYLVDQGFRKIQEIADAELAELIDILDEEQAKMLQSIAKQYIQAGIDSQLQIIKDANVETAILELENINNELVIKLIGKGITKLEDLADCAADELSDIMPSALAKGLIMQARKICWFNDEEEEA